MPSKYPFPQPVPAELHRPAPGGQTLPRGRYSLAAAQRPLTSAVDRHLTRDLHEILKAASLDHVLPFESLVKELISISTKMIGMLQRPLRLQYRSIRKVDDKYLQAPGSPERFATSLNREDAAKLIGLIPDLILSKYSGLNVELIRAKREALGWRGLPSRKTTLPFDLFAELGRELDARLALKYSVKRPLVSQLRMALGIKAFKPKPLDTNDSGLVQQIMQVCSGADKALASQLGKISDSEFSKLSGMSLYKVTSLRNDLGISLCRPNKQVQFDESLLGTATDVDIARRCGVPLNVVQRRRIKLGIDRYRVFSWTTVKQALLGTLPDEEVAGRLGTTADVVRAERLRQGIAPCGGKNNGSWTAELKELVGRVPDQEVAAKSNGALTVRSVRRYRYRNNIPLCPAPKPESKGLPEVSADLLVLMGVINDYEIARRTGVERSKITVLRLAHGIPAVRSRRPRGRVWTAEEDALFDSLSIGKIAAHLKLSESTVRKRKQVLSGHYPSCNSTDWMPNEDALLGTMADSMLAHMLKRSFWDVHERRKMLDIAPFRYAYS